MAAQVLQQAGAVVKEEVVRALIVLISNAPDLHGYAARCFYSALKADVNTAAFPLVMASTWIIGAPLPVAGESSDCFAVICGCSWLA